MNIFLFLSMTSIWGGDILVTEEYYGKEIDRYGEIKQMFEKNKKDHRKTALEKEWDHIIRQERKMVPAERRNLSSWKKMLEDKIPDRVYENLRAAFGKAFALIFEKGEVLIEKTYNKEELLKDFAIRDYAVGVKGDRKTLKEVRRKSGSSDLTNMTISAVEGIGLGILGIGLPDIVIFTGILLKGIYETALHYGFDYDDLKEKLLILKMMEASLLEGDDWIRANKEVNEWLRCGVPSGTGKYYQGCSEEVCLNLALREQVRKTADVFALDMLLLKFVQGLPVVGIAGGAANPVYYNRVMKYVKLMYQKRYLLKKINEKRENGGDKTT